VTRRRSRASDVGGAVGAGGAGAEDEDPPAVNKSGRPCRRAAAAGRGKRYVVESSEGEDEEDDEEDEDGEEDGEERRARSGRGMEAGSRNYKKRARLFEGASLAEAKGVRRGMGEEWSEGKRGFEASRLEERKRKLAKENADAAADAAYRAIFMAAPGPTWTFFRY